MQSIAVDHVDVVAVGLDEVSFVNSVFLIVGSGVVLPLLTTTLIAVGARGGIRAILHAEVIPRVHLVDAGLELGEKHQLEVGLELRAGLILDQRGVMALDVIVAVVIAAGGGGIPVVERDGQLRGVEAVVDKDLATLMLALEVEAQSLVLVTGVEGVYKDFGTERAQLLRRATVGQLRTLAAQGHFPPGTMGPKVEAAAAFAERTGRQAIICLPADLPAALAGAAGTQITGE